MLLLQELQQQRVRAAVITVCGGTHFDVMLFACICRFGTDNMSHRFPVTDTEVADPIKEE